MLSTGAVMRHARADEQASVCALLGAAGPSAASLNRLRGEFDACDTPESLASCLARFAQVCGFDAGMYLHLGHSSPAHQLVVKPLRTLSTGEAGMPAHSAIGPVPQAFLPFAWRASDDPKLAGVTIPVQDHAAGPACLVLSHATESACHALAETQAPALLAAALTLHMRATALKRKDDVFGDTLSDREIECLRLAALGQGLSGIAAALGISVRTVEIHVGRGARKLSARNKIHAVAIAVGAGLIRV